MVAVTLFNPIIEITLLFQGNAFVSYEIDGLAENE